MLAAQPCNIMDSRYLKILKINFNNEIYTSTMCIYEICTSVFTNFYFKGV